MEAHGCQLLLLCLCLAGAAQGLPQRITDAAEYVTVNSSSAGRGHGGGRIVGGFKAQDNRFPYQVSVQEKKSHVCGGSILTERHVLTAGHCVTDKYGIIKRAGRYRVGYGSVLVNKLSHVAVTHIWLHGGYTKQPNNDLAVLYLKESLVLSPAVQPIAIWRNGPLIVGQNCLISGWGALEAGGSATNQLLYVYVPIRDMQVCHKAYGFLPEFPVCAGTSLKDSCQGDSGGPLVCDGLLVGVVSFGYQCGLAEYPGVYTDLGGYGDWLEDKLERSAAPGPSAAPAAAALLLGLAAALRPSL